MRIERSYVFLDNVRFHAFHGVLPQERQVGADFSVTLRVGYDVALAVDHDAVDVTLDYAILYELLRQEMQKPSDLLEHVAGRIAQAVFARFPRAATVDVTVVKLNPPMGADCAGAGIELHLINDKTQP